MYVLCCSFWAQLVSSQLADPTATEWSNDGPLIDLGRRDQLRLPYQHVDVPVSVVESALKVLGGKPEEWVVNHMQAFPPSRDRSIAVNEIVELEGKKQAAFVCLIRNDRWIRLNVPKGLPCISTVLSSFLLPPAEMQNKDASSALLENVAYLYKGVTCTSMSGDLQRQVDNKLETLLKGREKDPKVLLNLCTGPVVTVTERFYTIECNMLTRSGSVERWILTVKRGARPEIDDVSVSQLYAPGEFSWPFLD